MLDLIVNTIAVPFGYTSELTDSEVSYFGDSCFPAAGMWTPDSRHPSGWSLLPDIIQSTTPPPSPLRRALSSNFVFPDKTRRTTVRKTQSLGGESKGRPIQTVPSRPREREPETTIGLPDAKVTDPQEETIDHTLPDLPSLTWKLPRFQKSPDLCKEALWKESEKTGGRDSVDNTSKEDPNEDGLKNIGLDLRKVADQFELDRAKMNAKMEEETVLRLALPAAFSKCVTASVLCLIWWRIFNRLR